MDREKADVFLIVHLFQNQPAKNFNLSVKIPGGWRCTCEKKCHTYNTQHTPARRDHPPTPHLLPSLKQDPTQRLGERKGVGELKRHPFFENVHWALIANRDAPFRVWGPDSAGWAEMVANSSDGGERVNRDEKFATWTWQVSCTVPVLCCAILTLRYDVIR